MKTARDRVRALTATVDRPGRLARFGVVLTRAPHLRSSDPDVLGAQVAGALLGVCVLVGSTEGARMVAAAPLGVGLGARAGLAWFERAARRAARDARATLPQTLDRLTTCVLAGMSVERALRVVAPQTSGSLGAALAGGLRALDAGMPRARAYQVVAHRAPVEEVRTLMASLARAERFGASVADTLVAHARDVRSRARAAAEQEARTVPVKLIFPLVFCFLPAFVLLTIAPIAISAVRTLAGI